MAMLDSRGPRVLVADDHQPTLLALGSGLRREGFEVVAECSDGRLAIAAASATAPDLCLLDVQMPGASGIEVAFAIARTRPAASIVLMTVAPNERDLAAALRVGAHGYLGKHLDPGRLAIVLRAVWSGETSFPRALLRQVLAERLAA